MQALIGPGENTRTPSRLRELGRLPQRRRRGVLAGLALLLLLVSLAVVVREHLRGPERLDDVRLVGARGPEPINVVLALDESGSFADYAPVRAEVLRQVIGWGRDNLRADDTLTVVSFAGDGGTRLPTTPLGSLAANPTYEYVELGDGTNFQPALAEAADVTAAAGIDGPVALVVLTDTITADVGEPFSPEVDRLVDDLDATSMTVIVPDGVDIEGGWHDTFDWALELDAGVGSADKTALAVGRAMAHATGQRLEER